MPKPPGLSWLEELEYYKNRNALHDRGVEDTTSANSSYTRRLNKNQNIPPLQSHANPSLTQQNKIPHVNSSEVPSDPPTTENLNNNLTRVKEDPYVEKRQVPLSPELSDSDWESPLEESLTPELSEPSSGTEDEGEGSNEVQGPPLKAYNNFSSEDNGDSSKPKAKKKIFF